MKHLLILLIVTSIVTCCARPQITGKGAKDEKVIIGYVFPGNRLMKPEEIAAEKLTHINYAFANIKDGKIIEGFENDAANYTVLNQLKERNPDLKILVSVGGWTWSGDFSDMALTPESRALFIESAVDFMLKYKLDGLDLDWEYPGLRGNNNTFRAEDKENFVALLKECRQALDAIEGDKYYLLTIAAGAFADFVNANDMRNAAKYLDLVNLMTYDFMGEWGNTTGHHSNLFYSEKYRQGNSTENAVNLFVEAGVPENKIVIGAAFYGRGWQNVAAGDQNGLGQEGTGLTGWRLGYNNLVTNILPNEAFQRYWDNTAKAPYIYNQAEGIFITYEDPASIAEKCRFVNERSLRGVMFWQYFSDYEEELLDAIYSNL